MRSEADLLEASGYADRPRDFDDLIHILDPELRLITPTEPEGVEGGGWRVEGGGWRVEGQAWRVEGRATTEEVSMIVQSYREVEVWRVPWIWLELLSDDEGVPQGRVSV